jgi:octaprenyl-diphosphate synthase
MNQLLSSSKEATRTSPLFAPIARDLEEVERILSQTIRNSDPAVAALVEHVARLRGKRLRPALLLLTARACGQLVPAHPTLAAVLELIHTATLVHDDVLDGAAVRRHVCTVNAGWGNHNSILFGDYLFTHAFHLATTLGDIRACQIIGETTNRVCEGELRQGLQRGNLALGESEYFDIIDAKTAELIACCCHLGALFSGAEPDVVASLTRYGRWMGMAFQIADDLLDLVGDEETTGKSLGTDLEQRKMTLPLIHFMETAPAMTIARLRQVLSSPGNHKREALRPYLTECGSLDYAYGRADELAERARAELSCLPASSCRDILEAATENVVRRKS